MRQFYRDNLLYITKRVQQEKAVEEVELLTKIFKIAPVNKTVITKALKLGFKDFEDAIIHESARVENVDGIVTRNIKDFKEASIRVYSPRELLDTLKLNQAEE